MNNNNVENENNKYLFKSKTEFLTKTLSEDYPGLDFLGVHNVLHAKALWYKILWISILVICFCCGVYTVFSVIKEYHGKPSATRITVHSVHELLLPQITICPTNPMTLNVEKMAEGLFAKNNLSNWNMTTVYNFANFMLLGSGFHKVDLNFLEKVNITEMTYFYDIFRRNLTVLNYFSEFFNIYGLQCSQLFKSCSLGSEKLDCCKIMIPTYTIRRGRCFRTIELKQKTFDELGKLKLEIRKPKFMTKNNKNIEIIAFIGEHKESLAPFPRYYINEGSWIRMRIFAKYINLIERDGICTDEVNSISKASCYLRDWMRTKVEDPLNCTFPFVSLSKEVKLDGCRPEKLAKVYRNIDDANYISHNCILSCDRWEYTVVSETPKSLTNPDDEKYINFDYRLDVSYNDLQYDVIEEVLTISFATLISLIGGQFSLFLGSSLLNFIQGIIMLVILSKRLFKVTQRKLHLVREDHKNSPKCNIKLESITKIEEKK
ncbi:Na+ channel, amiloride-sensitive family-containing protein [Strongyloides ratti]|uniref:Na+ channel, amiloride-sensitive family-containing protein n=1 Tax=Strongyloides ratti TaxID=34506 RepID=A0A090N0K7_STRRB|nr:Na+ channel, amiloride-sensitive family-containing protein [Strongyloides ratti]CEF70858.1 Na+ channel, amiloride-sensitive family-containing protein [Strongyloides ratti]